MQNNKNGAKIVAKIVFTGVLENQSPIIIGKTKGGDVDLEIVRDEKGNFYIPASSFIGVLRHRFCEYANISQNYQYQCFWGFQDDKVSIQSHLLIDDLKCGISKISIRDGIAINQKKGIAKQQAKYDYEVFDRKAEFSLIGEVIVRDGFDQSIFLKILATVKRDLEDGISVGAMTTKGFGRLKLNAFKAFLFEFPKDGELYLKFLFSNDFSLISNNSIVFKLPEPFPIESKDFKIDAEFQLKSSLIIGSYPSDPTAPDKVHLTRFENEPIISGTSLKGIIRSRAFKIVNTLSQIDCVELLKAAFGWVEVEKSGANQNIERKKKYRSRVVVEEIPLDGVIQSTQNRIKIDRFTGGGITGALFDSQPVWHKEETICLKIIIKNYEEWEAGLMLLILKDLWNGDLPIGGEKSIGRGVLKGKKADIVFNSEKISITQDGERLKIEGDRNRLESFVSAFSKKSKREN
ncbi:MAG: RAMP superfamily CRISPR-associated protein [Firmicutes bacterium]|nr:RAMP superfamily CRISPR-associated protein [Bacillota bacterium]